MVLKVLLSSLVLLTCASTPANLPEDRKKSSGDDIHSYWFNGQAEISSYDLKQARYGEIHEGHSVMVFVTEPFNPDKKVKSDYGSDIDVDVLKLNHTKKFNTGIYPYSMMTSTFLPVKNTEHSLKISSSSQEWCGHTYMELQNQEKFEIDIRSYFEDETRSLSISKELLEDDIWSKIRLNPDELPTGEVKMIPSFFYLRLKHKDTKAYSCVTTLNKGQEEHTYIIEYPELKRTLAITFGADFPHKINSWDESYPDGWTDDSPVITTTATLMKSILSDYWNKNSVKDSGLRKQLQLN